MQLNFATKFCSICKRKRHFWVNLNTYYQKFQLKRPKPKEKSSRIFCKPKPVFGLYWSITRGGLENNVEWVRSLPYTWGKLPKLRILLLKLASCYINFPHFFASLWSKFADFAKRSTLTSLKFLKGVPHGDSSWAGVSFRQTTVILVVHPESELTGLCRSVCPWISTALRGTCSWYSVVCDSRGPRDRWTRAFQVETDWDRSV